MAYGELQLTPAEFASFTPRELQWRIDGYRRLDHRTFYLTAWLASCVLGIFKSGMNPERLIGRVGLTALPPVPAHLQEEIDRDEDID